MEPEHSWLIETTIYRSSEDHPLIPRLQFLSADQRACASVPLAFTHHRCVPITAARRVPSGLHAILPICPDSALRSTSCCCWLFPVKERTYKPLPSANANSSFTGDHTPATASKRAYRRFSFSAAITNFPLC